MGPDKWHIIKYSRLSVDMCVVDLLLQVIFGTASVLGLHGLLRNIQFGYFLQLLVQGHHCLFIFRLESIIEGQSWVFPQNTFLYTTYTTPFPVVLI
jgi:hypothetical protein